MLATELIKKIEEIIKEHWDKEIQIDTNDVEYEFVAWVEYTDNAKQVILIY